MQFGCCTTMENYALLERLGYDYIELPGKVLAAMNENEFEHARALITQGKVKCCGLNAYCPADVVIAGPKFDSANARRYAKHVMKRLHLLGGKAVGVGSPMSRTLPENFDRILAARQIREFLSVTAEEAAPYGIQVLVEAVCDRECNFVNTTAEALEIVHDLQSDSLGIVYDVYHALCMGEGSAPLKRAFPYLRHLHICTDVHGERCYLDDGTIEPYGDYIRAAMRLGYDSIISTEAFSGDIALGAQSSLRILKHIVKQPCD